MQITTLGIDVAKQTFQSEYTEALAIGGQSSAKREPLAVRVGSLKSICPASLHTPLSFCNTTVYKRARLKTATDTFLPPSPSGRGPA
jgi:hypothetical protein